LQAYIQINLHIQFVPHSKHIRMAYVKVTLFRNFAVYCENHTKHIKTLCGGEKLFLKDKIGRYTQSYRCA
jgi:hypothetical protein